MQKNLSSTHLLICHLACSSSSQSHLMARKQSHAGPRPFSCDQCSWQFAQKSDLVRHERVHTNERPFKCDVCGKLFKQSGSLATHKRSHTGERPFTCETCGLTFAHRWKLTQHMRSHSGDRPFKCDICSQAFSQKWLLTGHRRTHTGERPYQCNVCGMTFAQNSVFFLHKRTHTGEKPFSCEVCGKTFPKKDNLTKHRRTHSGERPYVCDTCGRSFAESSTLSIHKATHSSDQPFMCDQCGKTFAHNRYLLKHKRFVHNIASSSRTGKKCDAITQASVCANEQSEKKDAVSVEVDATDTTCASELADKSFQTVDSDACQLYASAKEAEGESLKCHLPLSLSVDENEAHPADLNCEAQLLRGTTTSGSCDNDERVALTDQHSSTTFTILNTPQVPFTFRNTSELEKPSEVPPCLPPVEADGSHTPVFPSPLQLNALPATESCEIGFPLPVSDVPNYRYMEKTQDPTQTLNDRVMCHDVRTAPLPRKDFKMVPAVTLPSHTCQTASVQERFAAVGNHTASDTKHSDSSPGLVDRPLSSELFAGADVSSLSGLARPAASQSHTEHGHFGLASSSCQASSHVRKCVGGELLTTVASQIQAMPEAVESRIRTTEKCAPARRADAESEQLSVVPRSSKHVPEVKHVSRSSSCDASRCGDAEEIVLPFGPVTRSDVQCVSQTFDSVGLSMSETLCEEDKSDTCRMTSQVYDDVLAGKGDPSEHNRIQSFKCSQCSQTFSRKYNLTLHLRTHTGVKPFKCGVCGKSYSLRKTLQEHERIHSGERPYTCSVCGRSYAKSGKFAQHKRTHTGEKRYQCDQCGKKFTYRENLTRHTRTHSGERPFRCDQCDQAFNLKSTLNRHRRIHTGERPYMCDFCGKAFAQKESLAAHERIHTGVKPYRCDRCGRTFTERGHLKYHRRTHVDDQETL